MQGENYTQHFFNDPLDEEFLHVLLHVLPDVLLIHSVDKPKKENHNM